MASLDSELGANASNSARNLADVMASWLTLFRCLALLPFQQHKAARTSASSIRDIRAAAGITTSQWKTNTSTLIYSLLVCCFIYCVLPLLVVGFTVQKWAESSWANEASSKLNGMSSLLTQFALLIQPVLHLLCIVPSWPKFKLLLNQLSAINNRWSTADNKNAMSNDVRLAWAEMLEISTTSILNLSCYILMFVANMQYPWYNPVAHAKDMSVLFISFFVSSVGDIMFLVFNAHLQHGFKALVNDKLKALTSTPHQPQDEEDKPKRLAIPAWHQDSKTPLQTKKELDILRYRHGQLCAAVSKVAESFSPWALAVFAHTIICLILGTFVAIVSVTVGREKAPELVQSIATTNYPMAFAAVVRVLILCRSASKLKSEEKDTAKALAAFIQSYGANNVRRDDVHQTATIMTTMPIDMQILRFESQLTATGSSFWIGGYFQLSNGLFLSIVGNFSAYLIVMLQFSEGQNQQSG